MILLLPPSTFTQSNMCMEKLHIVCTFKMSISTQSEVEAGVVLAVVLPVHYIII